MDENGRAPHHHGMPTEDTATDDSSTDDSSTDDSGTDESGGTPPPPPSPPPGTGAPRLTRSSTDKMAAGVAGGLGHYFGVDPIIVRIAFVVLSIAGGAGFALYAAGWLLMPEDTGGDSILAATLHRDGNRRPLFGIVLAGIVFFMLADGLRFGRHDGVLFPFLLIGAGLAILWSKSNRGGSAPAWTREYREPAWNPPPAQSPPPPAAGAGRAPSLTGVVMGGLAVVGGILAVLNVTGLVHVSLRGFLGGALVATGAALLLSIWRGGTRGLIAVGLLLALALAITSVAGQPFHGGIGNRAWRPAGRADVRPEYRLGIGDMTLDLRDVAVAEGTTRVRASIGVGQLRVIAPEGVDVRVRGRAGIGHVDLFGQRRDGLNVEETDVDHASDGASASGGTASPGVLVLDVRAGIGDVEVARAAA